MKRMIRHAVMFLLALVTAASALTISASAKSDKSAKADKLEKEHDGTDDICKVSDESFSFEGAIPSEQACRIALDDTGLSEENLKYLTCYVSWTDHVPYAYEVKFSTRTEHYHYTIDLYDGTILEDVCCPRR